MAINHAIWHAVDEKIRIDLNFSDNSCFMICIGIALRLISFRTVRSVRFVCLHSITEAINEMPATTDSSC